MWDLSLPGYKYLGPGNRIDKGTPENRNDIIAFIHDLGYGSIVYKDGHPYLRWSESDAAAYEDFTTDDYGGALGKAFFGLKKLLTLGGTVGGKETADVDASGKIPLNAKRLRESEPTETQVKKRLRGTPVDNEEDHKTASVITQSAEPTTSMEGGGSGADAGLKETPIDDVTHMETGPPNYTFALLPIIEEYDIAPASRYSNDHIYRMTSPYDARVEGTTVDFNVGTGSANIIEPLDSGGVRSARWFEYYAGLYNYYHVIKCHYDVYIENFSSKPIWVYQMYSNDVHPPGEASNQDHQLWSGVRYHYLDRRFLATQSAGHILTLEQVEGENREVANNTLDDNYEADQNVSGGGKYDCRFTGEYRPGQYSREIRLDNQVENWTLTNTNPSLTERLIIRIKAFSDAIDDDSVNNYGQDLNYRIRIKLKYLVEFKELKERLRWPLTRQPLSVTINQGFT